MTQRPIARAQAARSASLMGAVQAYRVGLGFLSNVLLARLLTPNDFGLVAMVSTVVAFVALAQDVGLSQVTIQRPQISLAQISALFWTTSGISLALAVALASMAPLVALFFGEPRLAPLTCAFALLIFLNGSLSQLFALLNRELRFGAIATIDALNITASAGVGVWVAWLTESYWALFASGLASTLVSLTCLWRMCGFRPVKPSFQGQFWEFVHFGAGVSGFHLANYFARNADNILIGKFYGSGPLGYYDRAYRLLLFPLEQIRNPLGRIMVPALSRLHHEPLRYRNAYLECITLMMIAVQPGLAFTIVFANQVFTILFGSHWLAAAPIFQWLGACGLHQIMTGTTGWLFLSQGRGGDFFKIGLFAGITTVISFVVGLPWGPLGVAIAYALSDYVIRLPMVLWWACRRGPIGLRELVFGVLPHAAATCTTLITLMGIAIAFPTPSPVASIGLVVASYVVYGIVIAIFPEKRRVLQANLRGFAGVLPVWGRG
jgi:polysaccharide transporter, PST family